MRLLDDLPAIAFFWKEVLKQDYRRPELGYLSSGGTADANESPSAIQSRAVLYSLAARLLK